MELAHFGAFQRKSIILAVILTIAIRRKIATSAEDHKKLRFWQRIFENLSEKGAFFRKLQKLRFPQVCDFGGISSEIFKILQIASKIAILVELALFVQKSSKIAI